MQKAKLCFLHDEMELPLSLTSLDLARCDSFDVAHFSQLPLLRFVALSTFEGSPRKRHVSSGRLRHLEPPAQLALEAISIDENPGDVFGLMRYLIIPSLLALNSLSISGMHAKHIAIILGLCKRHNGTIERLRITSWSWDEETDDGRECITAMAGILIQKSLKRLELALVDDAPVSTFQLIMLATSQLSGRLDHLEHVLIFDPRPEDERLLHVGLLAGAGFGSPPFSFRLLPGNPR